MTVFTRFHMGPSVEEMLTVCLNGSAALNKMAAMPIYGQKLWGTILVYSFGESRSTKFVQMMRLAARMTFDRFMVWSNLCPRCCGNTGRMLHGICKYAIAVFIRRSNCGASCYYYYFRGFISLFLYIYFYFFLSFLLPLRKHTNIILTPLNPTFI